MAGIIGATGAAIDVSKGVFGVAPGYPAGAAFDPASGAGSRVNVFVMDLSRGRTRHAKFCANGLAGHVVLSGSGRKAAFLGTVDGRCRIYNDGPSLFRVAVR